MVQSCRLRALDKRGNPHIFTTMDVPVRVWEDSFILANVKDSPVLLIDSVVRMMDHLDVGEGDMVLYHGRQCTVSYNRGFQLTNDKGTVHPSNQVMACELLSIGDKTMSPICFQSKNATFRIRAFLGVFDGNVVTAHDPLPCRPSDVRLSADFVYQRQKLYYGDLVEGHPLIMWRGRPCIQSDGGYVEIPTHFYLGKD